MISPKSVLAAASALLALCGLSAPAEAIVGGADDGGPLGRSSVMVLNAHGGACTGVVVAADVVLTAAHCLGRPAETRVHFRDERGEAVLLEPAATALNAGYRPGAERTRQRSVDLGLVRLRAPLPARFVPATLSARGPAKGDGLAVGGYGVAREGDGRSSGHWRVTRLLAAEPYGPSTLLAWAAAPDGVVTGACQGDSGGPLAGPDGAVAAIVSWAAGSGGRGCGTMTQAVLVGPQRNWIDATLAGWNAGASWR